MYIPVRERAQMDVLHQVGAARIFHFDNELCSFYR